MQKLAIQINLLDPSAEGTLAQFLKINSKKSFNRLKA